MDEKTELSSDHQPEILDPVDSALEEEIENEEPSKSVENDQNNEDAGISQQLETNNEAVNEPEPTANDESVDTSNDENTLISELNDVPLTAAVNTETDSFLESLTSENAPGDTELPIPEEPNEANADNSSPDVSTDMSMPSLALSDEPQSINYENMEDNKPEETEELKDDIPKEDVTLKEKDPVCSLEEELQRMHEGDPTSQPANDVKVEDDKAGLKDEKSDVELGKTESTVAAIMKDSDLEEMLSADEVMQDPIVIKNSQEELKQIDILVCGKCHEVFYLVEEFQEHKLKKCSQISKVIPSCMLESKSQVWAFALWKSKQVKLHSEKGISRTQWELYKDWCTLAQTDKDAWISAGETLQYCQKLGTAKLTEIKPNNDANSNKAMRTVQTKEKSEYAVEKIVAKRFNPKKKTLEYQIKWEHFSSEDNTWEPLANLNHCKQMVDEFEEQLKKLKAEKAKQQAMALAKNSPKLKSGPATSSPASSSSLLSSGLTGNRPQRTSKQKALDQVKAWCGNISDDENISSLKRSRSPDSDESFEKRLKFDDLSEDSETETKPKIQFRKIAPKPTSATSTPVQVLKNGIGKNSPLPQNILIPDANGVVRINQKQLPSLSTGVYIMSKTAGIIKLDSDTSKVATSGGQTIVKVAPKIGQTQIKIMKKDGTSTQRIVQMSPKNIPAQKAMKTHLARAQKLVTEIRPSHQVVKKIPDAKKSLLNKPDAEKRQIPIKKLPELVPKQSAKVISSVKSKESNSQKDDESDDGLEELPFPDEIKIPEPDEDENSEFTLDPETGKIAGVEYPDPEPEPEPTEEAKSDSSLDNIVKLAAADITEEDLKNEPQDPVDIHMQDILEDEGGGVKIIKTEPQHITEKRFATASPMKPVVKMSVTPRKVAANPTSILNKALTGPHVVRRTVVGPPTPRLQQKIANQSIGRTSQASPLVRQVNTYVRTKPTAPKPKFNVASEPPKFIRPNHNTSPKNVYSYTRQIVQNASTVRKIGNTTVKSSNMVGGQQKMQTKLVRTSSGVVQRIVSPARKEPMVIRGQPERIERKMTPQKPKTVISMPSLMSDDELLLTSKTPQKRKQEPSPMQISAPEVNEHEQMEEQPTAALETPIIQYQQEPDEIAADAQPVATLAPDMSSFTLADNENPIFITGDDGTVYQVAGQNEQGQTILLTQGSDGQQQCLLVTNEVAEAMETPAEEAPQVQPEISMPEINPDVTEPLSVKTDPVDSSDQVVAQVVRAEPPSPGGTHKVVVMLPDGNLMVTQVSPEEYASLELE